MINRAARFVDRLGQIINTANTLSAPAAPLEPRGLRAAPRKRCERPLHLAPHVLIRARARRCAPSLRRGVHRAAAERRPAAGRPDQHR
eukprot:6831814-Prymnesium_polylepis.1